MDTEGCTNLQSDLLHILGVSGKLNGCGITTAITGLGGWNQKNASSGWPIATTAGARMGTAVNATSAEPELSC